MFSSSPFLFFRLSHNDNYFTLGNVHVDLKLKVKVMSSHEFCVTGISAVPCLVFDTYLFILHVTLL
jgi:hypothetical protein